MDNSIPHIDTDHAIGDTKLGKHPITKVELDDLIRQAGAAGVTTEQFMLDSQDAHIVEVLGCRGKEGWDYLIQQMMANEGMGIISTHGGARFEAMLLEGMRVSPIFGYAPPIRMVAMKELGVVLVTLNDDLKLTSFEILPEID